MKNVEMKKYYMQPDLEVVMFNKSDVLTFSKGQIETDEDETGIFGMNIFAMTKSDVGDFA